MTRRLLFCALCALAVGCSLDLDVPEQPAAGAIAGVVDTAPDTTGVSPVGLTVTVIDSDGLRRPVVTEADGGFTAPGLAPGLYALESTPPGFAPLVVPNVRVRPGATTDVGVLSPVSLRNSPDEGRLLGVVTAPSGAQVLGASVEFLLAPNDDRIATVIVGFDGAFNERLPPGTYRLRATHPDFVTAELADVTLLRGQTRDLASTPLVLGLNPATLNGVVLREVEGGAPVPAQGALVVLSNGATTATDATGAFTLPGLPAGAFTWRVELANHFDPSPGRAVTLRAGQTTDAGSVTVSLVRGVIEGTVELSDRAPIDVVSVSAVNTATQRGYAAVVSPDPTQPWRGSFSITNVPSGAYEVQAQKARYSRATASVTVTTGSVAAGTLVLALQQGDFLIDDADTTNTAGYTRERAVTLRFTGFPATGVTDYRVSEDPNFPDAGFTPYTGVQQPYALSSPGDGTKTVYAQYRDTSGSTSPTFQNSIVLDTVAPPRPTLTLAHTGTPNGAVRFSKANQVLPLTVVAADDRGLAGMRIAGNNAVDGTGALAVPKEPVQSLDTFTRTTSADGAQTVYLQVVDHAGNLSPIAQDTIIVDATAPVVSAGTVTIPIRAPATEAGFTNTPFVDVNLNATPQPNGEALYVKLANGSGPELDAALYSQARLVFSWITTPTDGLKTVYAVLQDSAGNVSAVTSGTITLDTVPPSPVGLTLQSGLVRSATAQVTVTSSATDLATTPLWLSDSPTFTGVPTMLPGGAVDVPLTTVPATPGVYPATVYARLRDRAGNTTVVSAPLTVDSEPPTGSITVSGALADGMPDENLTATTSVTVDAQGVNGATGYLLGTDTLTSCPDPLNAPANTYTAMPGSGLLPFTLGGSGLNRFVRACFRDAAGNTLGANVSGAWQPGDSIRLDNVAPAGCTFSLAGRKVDGTPAPAGKTALEGVVTTLNCPETGIEGVVLNGATSCSNTLTGWRPLAQLTTVTLPPTDGTKTVSACVRDDARNLGNLLSATLQLDTTPPNAAASTVEFNDGLYVYEETQFSGRGPDYADGGLPLRLAVETEWADATELELTVREGRGQEVTTVFTPTAPMTGTVTAKPSGLMAQAQLLDVSAVAGAGGSEVDVRLVYRDDVGNATQPRDTSVIVDIVRPEPPVLTGVTPGNRSGTLYWLRSPSSDVVNYETGTQQVAFVVSDTLPASANSGPATGLENQRQFDFGVRAVDGVGNRSVPSNLIKSLVGWRSSTVPINSIYPLRPLDIAVRGDDVYLTFSERDAEGFTETGNVRMAYSPDRGRTWQLSTVDPVFGWNRKVARITVNESQVVVVTVGSDQDPASSPQPSRGEVKIFSSSNGVTWTKSVDTNLPTTAYWGEVGGGDAVVNGGIARAHYVSDPGGTNVVNDIYALVNGSTYAFTSSYYNHTDSEAMNDLRVCSGNYQKVLMWRRAGDVMALTHHYVFDGDFASGEGGLSTVHGSAVDAFDLACAATPSANNAYVVLRTGATINFRGRVGTSVTWAGNLTSEGNADLRYPPRIHAAGLRAFFVYRSTTQGVRLGMVNSAGNGLDVTRWTQLEPNLQQGHWPVIGGDGVDDTVLAWTDSDASTLTVLVPELPGVTGRALPGIDTASLAWSGGDSEFLVRTSDQSPTPTFNPTQSYTLGLPSFEVTQPADEPLFHEISALDAHGQGSGQGEIWQVAPFALRSIFAASSVGSSGSNTGGAAAHDDAVVVLPPWNLRAAGDSDLTLYRSIDKGVNWAAWQPPAAVTTSTARAMDGARGRAVLAYRTSTLNGLRARIFSSLTGAYPTETVLNNSWATNHVAVGTDRNLSFAVVASSVATDQIGVWWSSDGVSFTQRTPITIPDGASYAIEDVSVWRVDLARLVVSWRQTDGNNQRIYYAESINSGTNFGTPVLLRSGSAASYAIGTSSITRGAGNGAYSWLGYVSQANTTPPRSANLYLLGTGIEHPATATNFTTILLDQDPVLQDGFDVMSTPEGHVVAYHAYNLVGFINEASLKMAVCTIDCHVASNWYRRTLATWPVSFPSSPKLSPFVIQSTVSNSDAPRWYVFIRQDNQLKVLAGGLVRRVR